MTGGIHPALMTQRVFMANNPPPQGQISIPNNSINFVYGYLTIVEPISTLTEGAWVEPEDGPLGSDHSMHEPSR
jgi:hypothetical protein